MSEGADGAAEQESLGGFLAALASRASTPGGGGAASLLGAIGAALAAMVCQLTVGRKKFAAVEADLQVALAEAERLRPALIAAIDADARAFGAVMAAYGLPKLTADEQAARGVAIQAALRDATDAPLDCARLCHAVIGLADVVSRLGNPTVVSDGGVAALAAAAGLRSAALNVYVNLRAIEDQGFVADRLGRLDDLLGAVAASERTHAEVVAALRPIAAAPDA